MNRRQHKGNPPRKHLENKIIIAHPRWQLMRKRREQKGQGGKGNPPTNNWRTSKTMVATLGSPYAIGEFTFVVTFKQNKRSKAGATHAYTIKSGGGKNTHFAVLLLLFISNSPLSLLYPPKRKRSPPTKTSAKGRERQTMRNNETYQK